MTKEQAQKILNLANKAINEVETSAHQEQFILKTEEKDNIYLQVLSLLKIKRERAENILERFKE